MDNESREMFQRLFEKLDHIESKLEKVEVSLDQIEVRLDQVEGRLDQVEGRLDQIDSRLDKVDSKLDRLEGGQAEIKKQLYRMDRRITDTYNLTLDVWAQGVENREWLESMDKIKA